MFFIGGQVRVSFDDQTGHVKFKDAKKWLILIIRVQTDQYISMIIISTVDCFIMSQKYCGITIHCLTLSQNDVLRQ